MINFELEIKNLWKKSWQIQNDNVNVVTVFLESDTLVFSVSMLKSFTKVVRALDSSDIENKVTCEIMIPCCLIRGSGTHRSTFMDVKCDIGLINVFVSVQGSLMSLSGMEFCPTSIKGFGHFPQKYSSDTEKRRKSMRLVTQHLPYSTRNYLWAFQRISKQRIWKQCHFEKS